MKINKKSICISLVFLLLMLASCGRDGASETTEKRMTETTAAETITEETTTEETTTEETTTEEITTEALVPPDPYEDYLSQMSPEEKVGQLFIIRVESAAGILLGTNGARGGYTSLSEEMEAFLAEYPPGGFCLFADNIQTPEQLAELVEQLNACESIPPILCIDEEGGGVRRLGANGNFDVDYVGSMESIEDAEEAYAAGSTIGSYLSGYGFTLDLAPVADVKTNSGNTVIGSRAFGSDPQRVAELTESYLDGLHAQGMKGCMKHFPGQGGTSGDTHNGVVTLDKTWQEMTDCELVPYLENDEKTDAILVAHILLPQVTTDGYPASLSAELITGKLRGELGYEGLVMTDSLAMGAIVKEYGPSEAAVMALEAGNDILLMPQNYEEAYLAVLEAVKSGRVSEEQLDEHVLRILKFKDLHLD